MQKENLNENVLNVKSNTENFILIQFNCHIFNLTLRGIKKPDKGWDFQPSLT